MHVDTINNSLVYYIALKNAGVPPKCTYMRKASTPSDCAARFPITRWPDLVETWLHTIGID